MKIPEELRIVTHEADPPERLRAKRRGEVIHRALALLGRVEDLEKAVLWALNLMGEPLSDWDLEEEFMAPLRGLLTNPQAARWVQAEGMEEVEVVDPEGRVHRLDKLVVGEGEVHVIEFKASDPQPSHREQLRLYLYLVKDLFPDKAVRGWLIYVDQVLVEELTGP